MEKIFKYSVVILLVVLLAFSILIYFKSSDKLGSTTAGNISIGGTLSVTGASTLTGATTVTGNMSANGGFIVSGTKDYGEEPSVSFSTSDICDYSTIQIDPDFEDDIGASFSFPNDESLAADCMGSEGDIVEFRIYNSATSGSAYLDFVETGQLIRYSSASTDFEPNNYIMVNGWNYNGTSISWVIDGGYVIE